MPRVQQIKAAIGHHHPPSVPPRLLTPGADVGHCKDFLTKIHAAILLAITRAGNAQKAGHTRRECGAPPLLFPAAAA
ncbi:hypothetical protein LBMAG56_30680 [Verrucomicrobiota bacterium]|nr:hypothetical protein LBMAG56_30680 [Verrucomicrobiota bacterium]